MLGNEDTKKSFELVLAVRDNLGRPTEPCHPSDSKYTWMLHSEPNAVLNCNIKPKNATAYITGKPCFPCLIFMWQAGVREIVCGGQASSMRDEDKNYDDLVEEFLWRTRGKLKIRALTPDAQSV